MIVPQPKNAASARARFKPATLVKKDPETAALLTKVVADRNPMVQRDHRGNRASLAAETQTIRELLGFRGKKNRDAELHLQLNPDLEMTLQIIVSSILSPSDMMSTSLSLSGPEGIFTSDLSAQILTRLDQYLDKEHSIKKTLPVILRKILGEEGSYPVAVFPENALDRIINSDLPVTAISKESYRSFINPDGTPKALGILGSATVSREKRPGIGLESFSSARDTSTIDQRLRIEFDGRAHLDEYVTVTDNPSVTRLNSLYSKIRGQEVRRRMTQFGLESAELSDHQIEKLMTRPRNYAMSPVELMPKQSEMKRKSVGKPLVMHFNSSAVAVVHTPGDPTKQVGYYVLLDAEGHAVDSMDEGEYYNTVGNSLQNPAGNYLSTNLLQRVSNNLNEPGQGHYRGRVTVDMAAKIYSDLVERDLIARVKNGVHATSVHVTPNEEIYRLMLARSLAQKYTQLLYVPIEYFTYFAFDHDHNGLGRSLLEKTSVINTLRSVLLFNDVMSSIRNSLGRTNVKVELDENDPSPARTMEMVQEEVIRSGRTDIPTTAGTPAEIQDFINRAGYRWAFSGHPRLPKLNIEFEDNATSIPKSDTDLVDLLKKLSIQGQGMSPETIDNGYAGEFATSIAASNILFGKRIMTYQELFCPQLSDHIRKLIGYSESIMRELKDIVKERKDDIKLELEDEVKEILSRCSEEEKSIYLVNRAVREFVLGINAVLPQPPSVSMENQVSDLETYIRGIDAVLDAYISSDWMTDTYAGEASQSVDTMKAMYKAWLIRQYVADKGIMPELTSFMSVNDEGEPRTSILDETIDHIQGLVKALLKTEATLKPIGDAATRDMQRIGSDGSDSGDASSGDDEGDTSGSDSGGDDLGGDDLGGGDDFGSDPEADPAASEGESGGEGEGDGAAPQEEGELEDEPKPDQ